MAKKCLGQKATAATTTWSLYTVPASKEATISSIVVCNRGTTATAFRISVRIAGAGAANDQYLYYDCPIAANDTFIATIGITLATTDILEVYAGNANLSFNAFGDEAAV